MVFPPFVSNPLLRSRFTAILTDEVAAAPSKVRLAVANLVSFLETNYLVMHEDQSFKNVYNWDYFTDVLSGEPDTTNNCSESINRKFNHEIKLGFKSFKKVSISIFTNKKNYIDRLHETVKRNRFRKRPLALRVKMHKRENEIFNFSRLSPDEQISTYKTFLSNIQKYL